MNSDNVWTGLFHGNRILKPKVISWIDSMGRRIYASDNDEKRLQVIEQLLLIRLRKNGKIIFGYEVE